MENNNEIENQTKQKFCFAWDVPYNAETRDQNICEPPLIILFTTNYCQIYFVLFNYCSKAAILVFLTDKGKKDIAKNCEMILNLECDSMLVCSHSVMDFTVKLFKNVNIFKYDCFVH